MTNTELHEHIKRQEARGMGNTQMFKDEYYKRYANPFAALILMLIGVSLSSKKIRGGMGLQIGIGIALSALYILFTTISSMFAVKGNMPVLAAVWLPNIIFLFIGITLYFKAPK
jgi:lipopolysaccharide export system permease protein